MKKRRILILFAAVVLSAGFFLYHRLRSVRAPEFVLSYAENQTEDYPTTLGAKKFAELRLSWCSPGFRRHSSFR